MTDKLTEICDTKRSEVAARKKAEKEAKRAELLRRGGIPEKTDPYISNYNR